MSKWVKNNTLATKTYAGKDILAGAYREVDSDLWSKDSALLTDIGNGDAIMAKDDSGTTDITNVNEAIDFLKDNLPKDVVVTGAVENSGVKDPKGMRARLVGIISNTITAGSTTDLDWACPQLQYQGTNKPSYFDGIQYYAKDAEVGDKASFQVVDKDGVGVTLGWYNQATFDAMGNLYIVEEFGKDWYMMPNEKIDLMLYKAAIIPGLYIRMKYTSTGTTDVKIVINLFRHLDGNS